MKVKILIESELGDLWATEEDLSKMTDMEILNLIAEDYGAFLDEASMKVVRFGEEETEGG